MRLKLEHLQRVVDRALDEEAAVQALRLEVKRVIGPSVVAEAKLDKLAEAVNDRLDVLERTGQASRLSFDERVFVPLAKHSNPEVRKLAARALPQRIAAKMAFDSSDVVRGALAKKLPVATVKEMIKRYPTDDAVRAAYRARLAEAGLPDPKADDGPFDYHGERLGDAVKQAPGPELSDQWYESVAFKMIQDLGGNFEGQWEGPAARRYARSLKATTGIEVDEEKLHKAIVDQITDKEDRHLERDALKETVAWLRRRERLDESAMPVIDEAADPVRELLEAGHSAQDYVSAAGKLFCVQESELPRGIRKHRLGEGNAKIVKVPVVGRLPHSSGFRSVDEQALDLYCRHWTERQAVTGEPLKLEWTVHPDAVGKVGFTVVLK